MRKTHNPISTYRTTHHRKPVFIGEAPTFQTKTHTPIWVPVAVALAAVVGFASVWLATALNLV